MKRTLIALAVALISFAAAAQDGAAEAAAAAAEALSEAPEAAAPAPRFKDFWTESLATNLTVGQTSLTNWAAGGDNTFSLGAHVDGNANYKKDEMYWNNRLQLDYGLLYASSKPIFQKNNDRIYLESKWGYEIKSKLFFSANYDFKSQFMKGYNYGTPDATIIDNVHTGATSLDELTKKEVRQAWKDARVAKSGFISPAYTNLALGIDWKPKDWFSVSLAPLTGGYVIVYNPEFRKAYGMDVAKEWKNFDYSTASLEKQTEYDKAAADGTLYRGARFEFGARLKVDLKAQINEVFKYTTQLVLFEDYLTLKTNPCPRVNWDNRIDWKLAKYFALTVTTNLIYDDMVMIKTDKWNQNMADNGNDWAIAQTSDWAKKHKHINDSGVAAVQFMESIQFGFTYTIASKK